jgi:hypothetical protein
VPPPHHGGGPGGGEARDERDVAVQIIVVPALLAFCLVDIAVALALARRRARGADQVEELVSL